jgi:probable rRNA maturation factor
MVINFFFLDKRITLKERTRLKEFLMKLFKKEKTRLASLNYIFCSDEFLLSINQQFLNHDFYTDIITFDLSETKNSVEGEIYISIDRIKENSGKEKTTFVNELHRVIFHGALHLSGYKDKTVKEIKKMRVAEDYYLKRYFS